MGVSDETCLWSLLPLSATRLVGIPDMTSIPLGWRQTSRTHGALQSVLVLSTDGVLECLDMELG